MKRLLVTPALVGVLVLTSSAAGAATIATPALNGVEDGGFDCNVVNVSPTRQMVTVQILGSEGPDETSGRIDIPAGSIFGLSGGDVAGPAYCRVDGSNGINSALRVSFESSTSGGETVAVVQGE